jgi:hypothetical protein
MRTPQRDREKFEKLLAVAKEMVLNIQRLAEEAELTLRRANKRVSEFLDESDDFGR